MSSVDCLLFCHPKELTAIARETKFIQRERKLDMNTFLHLLFDQPGAVAGCSLTHLCAKLAKRNRTLSKQALDKRFNKNAVQFLEQIFLRLFDSQFQMAFSKLPIATTHPFRSMRILDGSSIKLPDALHTMFPGTTGGGVKCQLEFDYLTGKFYYVELQPGKAGDSPSGLSRLESVQKDDLLLQDLGYFKCDLFRKIEKKEAFYVSRARADTMFYVNSSHPRYHKNGELMKKYAHIRLYLEEEVQTMKPGESKEFPRVYIGKHERMPARLVIYRMTAEEQKRQEFRIKRRKQTKPGIIKQKVKDLSSLSLYVTNLPTDIPASEICTLYRYRWQIELLFKSWKSDLGVAPHRNMKLERWMCHLYAELIIFLLSVLLTYQVRHYFWREKQLILSERIAIREVSERVWKLVQARASPKWKELMDELLHILASNGRKNVRGSGPISWLT
ncbi:IS4 family transposase [Sporosarcina sp. P37]|uniref:IS4 family transposase n=1 Tax=Sporosarcina sp. P37 TaxID=1930546 RepID=UPI002101946F|nr:MULTISPECIES: IS4 family transposase [unclassified Sporosarcina]